MNKKPSIKEEYARIIALPKSTVDRRVNRPDRAIHIKELRQIVEVHMPKDLTLTLQPSTYTSELVVCLRPNYNTYYDLPGWKRKAYDALYDTWYIRSTGRSNQWIPNEGYTERVIARLESSIKAVRTDMLKHYRIERERFLADTEQSKSLKGIPRRVPKKGNFENFYYSKANTLADSGTSTIDMLPEVPSLPAARTWGIEIEVAGARGVSTPYNWDSVEDGSLRSAYDSAPDGDCECVCDYCAEWNEHDCGQEECGIGDMNNDCREFVSPVLRNSREAGIDQICNDVRFEPQNATAGIHVHVGADGLTPKQIGGLVYGYGLLERILEDSYKREDREYCAALDTEDVKTILATARTATRQDSMGVLDRYTTVNVQALSKHGTIEFRALGPVYEAEYIHKWALFCREMVTVAGNNVPMKRWNSIKNFEDVLQIFRDYGIELNQIEADIESRKPVARVLVTA